MLCKTDERLKNPTAQLGQPRDHEQEKYSKEIF
jgi:hypothetical protein